MVVGICPSVSGQLTSNSTGKIPSVDEALNKMGFNLTESKQNASLSTESKQNASLSAGKQNASLGDETTTYENRTEGIRFQYPSYWGNNPSLLAGEGNPNLLEGCLFIPCAIPVSLNDIINTTGSNDLNRTGNFTITRFFDKNSGLRPTCSCDTLMEFVKWTYEISRDMFPDFTFINDNQTTVGKKYPAWQYEFSGSDLPAGFTSEGTLQYPPKLIIATKINDAFYSFMFSPSTEDSRVKKLPEIRKLIDSVEFLPVKRTVPKTPSFMDANETQEPKSSTTADNNNTIFEENLPPTTVGDRQASLYTKISPPILTSDKKQNALFQLRLFDSKTGNNITNVNYFVTITKGGKLLLRELFYSKDGPLTLKFEPDQNPVTVHGNTEPFLGGWMNETGPITVSGPVLTEGGQYHYTVEIFGIDNVRNIFKPENAPRFDSSFFMNMNQTEQTRPSSMLESSPNGLQILSHNSFTDSVGYLHVVGEVQNNTPTSAQFVQVTGTFYDNNNQVVGTQFTYTNPSDIGAEDKAPFELILTSASVPIFQINNYKLSATSE